MKIEIEFDESTTKTLINGKPICYQIIPMNNFVKN